MKHAAPTGRHYVSILSARLGCQHGRHPVLRHSGTGPRRARRPSPPQIGVHDWFGTCGRWGRTLARESRHIVAFFSLATTSRAASWILNSRNGQTSGSSDRRGL